MNTPTPWQWVDLLYGSVTPPAGAYAEFRLLDPAPADPTKSLVDRAWLQWPSQDTGTPLWGKKKWLQGHVYMGMALRTLAGKEANSGTRPHTWPTHLVWVDIDLKHTVYLDSAPEEATPQALKDAAAQCMADVLALCEEHNLPPRAIIYSGHGIQVIWARAVRSTMDDTEAFNRGLAKLFDGDPVATDQARILRVPGWQHHKNPDRPLDVELWYQDAAATVADEVLEPLALRQEVYQRSGEVFVNQGNITDADLDILQEAWLDVDGHKYDFKGAGRHQLALYVGGWLRTNGYAEADALELVNQLATNGNDPAIQDRLRAVRDAYKTPNPKGWTGLTEDLGLPLAGIPMQEAPRPKIKGPAPIKATNQKNGEKLTLLELAELFLKHCAEEGLDYCFHEKWETWFQYRAGVYVEVHDNAMRKFVDQVLQAKGFTDLTRTNLNEILLKVAHMPGIGKGEVDQTAWELNVRNGILDLNTLELRPHTRDYFSVVQAACDWNPDAACPEWASFLTNAVPSQHDRMILQRYCGYTLTGDTSAQKALFLIGEGGTGKSTFTNVISTVLGGNQQHGLATSSDIQNIKDGSFLIGTLVGKRMCVVSELPRNFDWLPFKRITGEDSIGVDVKNKTPYTTKLNVKLFVLSNVLPALGEDARNSSLTRRFIPIAFNVRPQNPDPTLESRLVSPESLTGILTWMVKGLRALREDHMRFPAPQSGGLERQIVEQSNRVITFLEECCLPLGGEVSSKDLWRAYLAWCDDSRHSSVSKTRFGLDLPAALTALEWQAEKHERRAGFYWVGFQLKGEYL